MKPEKIINSIVSAVKSKEELRMINCMHSESREIARNPVCGFTLCLGLNNIKYNKNPDTAALQYLTSVKLSLLAPSGAGGKHLSEIAWQISEAIREKLDVNHIEVSEPKHIETSHTMFCEIFITVEDIEISDTINRIYINSVLEEKVISYEIESVALTEKIPELLKGYKQINTGRKEYTIKLKTESPIEFTDVFELGLKFDDYGAIYRNCMVKKVAEELSKWGLISFSYHIVAEECEVCDD